MKTTFIRSAKLAGLGLCILITCGCTTKQPQYHWGSYEMQVYSRLTSATSSEQQIEEMEKTMQTNPGRRPLPPGFHAHLGLLYGDVGRTTEMREQFNLEKQLYPEATAFMDFLLAKSAVAKGKE